MVDGVGIPPRTVRRAFCRTTSCVVLRPRLRNGGVQLEVARSRPRTQSAHRSSDPKSTQGARLALGAYTRKRSARRYARGPLELKNSSYCVSQKSFHEIECVIFVRDVPTEMRRVNGVVRLAVFRANLKVRVDAVCRMDKAVRTCTKVTDQTGTNSVVIRFKSLKNHRAGFCLYMNAVGKVPISGVRRVFNDGQINQIPDFGIKVRRFKCAGVGTNQAVNSSRDLRDEYRFFGQTGGESLVCF